MIRERVFGCALSIIVTAMVVSACTSSNTGGGSSGGLGSLFSGAEKEPEPDKTAAAVNLRAYCPQVIIRDGTKNYRMYEPGTDRADPDSISKLYYQATITEVARECNHSVGELAMRVGTKGRMINSSTRRTGTVELPVRIAVQRGEELIYSCLHKVPATILEGSTFTTFQYIDSAIRFPTPTNKNISIYVGFDEGPYGDTLCYQPQNEQPT